MKSGGNGEVEVTSPLKIDTGSKALIANGEDNIAKKALDFGTPLNAAAGKAIILEQPGGVEKVGEDGLLKAGGDFLETDKEEQKNSVIQAMHVDQLEEEKGRKKEVVVTTKSSKGTYKKRPRVVAAGHTPPNDLLLDGRKRSMPEDGGEILDGGKRTK